MGIKLDSCSCFKNTDDIDIEVELNPEQKRRIQILAQPNKFSLYKNCSLHNSLIDHQLSNIMNNSDNNSELSENSDIKPLINHAKRPEIIIQSIFRGYIYRKKFNEISGIKYELIEKNNEIIESIEKNFISKLTGKYTSIKIFIKIRKSFLPKCL